MCLWTRLHSGQPDPAPWGTTVRERCKAPELTSRGGLLQDPRAPESAAAQPGPIRLGWCARRLHSAPQFGLLPRRRSGSFRLVAALSGEFRGRASPSGYRAERASQPPATTDVRWRVADNPMTGRGRDFGVSPPLPAGGRLSIARSIDRTIPSRHAVRAVANVT